MCSEQSWSWVRYRHLIYITSVLHSPRHARSTGSVTQAEPATAVSWAALNICRRRLQSVICLSDFNNDTIVTICDKNHLHVWHQDQEDSYFYCIVISELKSWLRYDNHFILHDQRRPHLAELRTLKGILYNIHDIVKSSLLYLKSISVTVGSCLGKVDLENVNSIPGTNSLKVQFQIDWLFALRSHLCTGDQSLGDEELTFLEIQVDISSPLWVVTKLVYILRLVHLSEQQSKSNHCTPNSSGIVLYFIYYVLVIILYLDSTLNPKIQ